MNHLDCPRFYSCNAALCPIDPDWRQVQHLPGERVCYYALQSAKSGADQYHADDPAYAAVVAAMPAVLAKHPAIRRAVETAAKSGSRGANFRTESR